MKNELFLLFFAVITRGIGGRPDNPGRFPTCASRYRGRGPGYSPAASWCMRFSSSG